MAQIGTRDMLVEIDGEEYAPDVSNARFTSGEGDTDFLSFAAAKQGGNRDYTLSFTAAQDLAEGALWRLMWDSPGSEVVVTLMPYGNAVPSVTQPHVTATVVVSEPDGDMIGGEANTSTSSKMTWEGVWACKGRPVLVTTP